MFKTSKNHNSVKIVLDFTGVLRLLGNNSVISLLIAAKKRHFHPPKLPALRAEVDGLAQKSAKPFLLLRRLRLLPLPKSACSRSFSAFAVSAMLPHVGATSGFLLLDGYALGWAAKAAQTADTGATGCDWRFVCALNLCFQQNRHIFVLPHPRPVSASVGYSPAGVPPELVGW